MKKSFLASDKISKSKKLTTSNSAKSPNTITKEYLDNYINMVHPGEGNAFNILFSSNNP